MREWGVGGRRKGERDAAQSQDPHLRASHLDRHTAVCSHSSSLPPIRILTSPLLHSNPRLQTLCALSFLFPSDSQASTLPAALCPSTLDPRPTTFGLWLRLCRQTHFTCDLVVESGGHFFFGLFTSVDLTAVFPTTGKFFLKEFSTLSVEGCAPAFSRGCQTVVRFLCWKLLTVRLWGISVTLITSLLV